MRGKRYPEEFKIETSKLKCHIKSEEDDNLKEL